MSLFISVRRSPSISAIKRGRLRLGTFSFPCILGRAGLRRRKREGDGGTPTGFLRIQSVFFRPDRIKRPRTPWPTYPLSPLDGWCDDPHDPNYNRWVKLPYRGRHEKLWREDHLYDIILNTSWNETPRIRGAGSAIFIHLMPPKKVGTEGCIAVSWPVMRMILTQAPYIIEIA
jgi:L,D-peptidoglycan transpeptidase YkuD (ErfK/YbiS/YcfS/YnhG family)